MGLTCCKKDEREREITRVKFLNHLPTHSERENTLNERHAFPVNRSDVFQKTQFRQKYLYFFNEAVSTDLCRDIVWYNRVQLGNAYSTVEHSLFSNFCQTLILLQSLV